MGGLVVRKNAAGEMVRVCYACAKSHSLAEVKKTFGAVEEGGGG